jgi:hypothetical protein
MLMRRENLRRKATALVAALAIVAPQLQDVVTAQTKPAAPAAAKAAPAATKATPAATTPAPVDGGWPRAHLSAAGAQMLIYQPQVASWDNRQRLVAYSAVSYQAKGAQKPALGSIKLESDTSVSIENRIVRLTPIRVTESNFATLSRDEARDAVETITGGIPDVDRVIALDRVLAGIDRSQIAPKEVPGVKADPPPIFYSSRPAVLVNFDGDPIWSPIANNNLKFAVNTNWDIFQDEATKTFYLRNEKVWLKTSDVVKGPWTAAGKLPDSFAKLPADDNWKDVKASLPGAASQGVGTTIFVSTKLGELILLKGAPSYILVNGTQSLLWVNNTEADVFRLGRSGPVYFLVAGRWFSSPGFEGPWTFATTSLPEDFKKIPLEHPRSRVLASVPGTSQAIEGVLLAEVPQTARVNKKEIKAPEVAYQGEPQFQPIEQTTVARAVNTDKDIIRVGTEYYMCYQGVWFVSKTANGPWAPAEKVPQEVYTIPASSPSHNVTYVTVVEDDDDDWVTYAAVAGYTGMMVAWGCTVWGTGYYYPPYVWYGGGYPMYYPYYPTYGFGASYNPWTGAYTRGAAVYGPYGGAGVAARYNPRTGTYSRGAAAWGPYGSRGVASAYNPRTGASAATRQGSNVYGSWGSTAVQRGDQWAQTSRVTNNRTGATTRVTQGSGGGSAVTRNGPGMGNNSGVARTGSGDVYAGRDGNVYRKQGDSWQKYDNGSWGSVDKPTPQNRAGTTDRSTAGTGGRDTTRQATPSTASPDTMGQLDRDRAARTDGASRTRDYGNAKSSGATRSGGSYRPSGGARAGGGRRR